MQTDPATRDLYRMFLRDEAVLRRARNDRFWRRLMMSYPGMPAEGTQLRHSGSGRKRLVLVQR